MQSKMKIRSVVPLVVIAVALCLGLVACGWGPTGADAGKAYTGSGPGVDLTELNWAYAYGFSDIYFTETGFCYRYGGCEPYPQPSTYADMLAALDGDAGARGGVTTTASGPTKDHPWGGDVANVDVGSKAPVWCNGDESFVITGLSCHGDPSYLSVQWVAGPMRGYPGCVHKVVYQQSTFCGFTILGAWSVPVKGGAL